MLPPSGLFFECVTPSVYEVGAVVEMTGIGPSKLEDDDERLRVPFIWAVHFDEDETYGEEVVDFYFRSDDLRPLTPAACEAYADLLRLELTHDLKAFR